MSELTQFDQYLSPDGPAALVIREWLMPVEGIDGVLFPPTFAAAEDKSKFAGGYNIDIFPDGSNVALIDSVGSQANRIEPVFKEKKYAGLVPQILVKVGDKELNILEAAGHRAGDALVRCSSLQNDFKTAFHHVLNGDATALAKLAPTSLVFGVWDSRDTQAKLPRLVASTIRAYNVRPLHRSAQFNPATEYVNDKLLAEPDDKKTKDKYAERGFIHVPASWSHGGVIADGGIRRDATLGLAALRLLTAGKDEDKTLTLRRYILGLALVAFTYKPGSYLRQGCLLVLNPERAKDNEFVEVHTDGTRKSININHEQAVKFATEAASSFGIGESKTAPFEKEKAMLDVADSDETKNKMKKAAKGKGSV